MPSKSPSLVITAGVGFILTLLSSCSYDDTTKPPVPVCQKSEFLENRQYTGTNGHEGPPFPFVRHVFCTYEDQDKVDYYYEMSDALKKVHAEFGMKYSNFKVTDQGATAQFERATFRAKTDFAQENALSKWLTCRDGVRLRNEFDMGSCFEVHEDYIVWIGPGGTGGQSKDEFPCGINVGPDKVRDHQGDEVPDDVYSGAKKSLTGGAMKDEKHNFSTNERIKGIYVPEVFEADHFATTLSECKGGT